MNEPSIVSSSDMPAANRTGRQRISYHGSPEPAAPAARNSRPTSGAGGEEQQAALRRGVEAEPEQHAERVHLPRRADSAREPPEEAVHESARVELRLEGGLVELAAAHRPEHAHDPDENGQVQPGDDVEERPRDAGADDAGDVVQRRAVVLDLAGHRLDAEAEHERKREDDRR